MPSRNAYAALTPDHADFASSSSASLSRSSSPVLSTQFADNEAVKPAKFSAALSKVICVCQENIGLLLITASQVFLSLMNVAVKKLNNIDPPVSALELVVVRMVITYLCCISYMLLAGVPDPWIGPKGVRLLLAFRGFSGFFGLFGIYYSLQYLSLSDATVLTFLSPLTTAFAGAMFLGENFTRKEALAGVVSLIGVIMIARPVFLFGSAAQSSEDVIAEKGTPAQRLGAVGVSLVGVLGATGAYTSLRAIGKRAHPLHSMLSFSAQCVIVASIAMIATRSPFIFPTQFIWLALLFMIGICGFFAQVLLTMGLQRETAGRGAMAIYTQVIFATILERIFFHNSPSPLSVLGTLMIISSAVYVALTKETSDKTQNKDSNSVRLQIIEETLEEGLLDETREDTESRPTDTHIKPVIE